MDTLITSEWLKAHGVKLPDKQLNELVKAAQDELEMRAGDILIALLTPKQVEDFEKLYDEGKDDEAAAWLDKAIPDYKQTVELESVKMHEELEAAEDKSTLIRSWAKQRQG